MAHLICSRRQHPHYFALYLTWQIWQSSEMDSLRRRDEVDLSVSSVGGKCNRIPLFLSEGRSWHWCFSQLVPKFHRRILVDWFSWRFERTGYLTADPCRAHAPHCAFCKCLAKPVFSFCLFRTAGHWNCQCSKHTTCSTFILKNPPTNCPSQSAPLWLAFLLQWRRMLSGQGPFYVAIRGLVFSALP